MSSRLPGARISSGNRQLLEVKPCGVDVAAGISASEETKGQPPLQLLAENLPESWTSGSS